MTGKQTSITFKENTQHDIRVLEGNQHDIALLDRALKELFPPNFPQNEADEALSLVEELSSETPSASGSKFAFLLVGDNLDKDADKATIKGLAIGLLFPKSRTASTWYIVIDSKYRNGGIFKPLFDKQVSTLNDMCQKEKGEDLQAFFLHIHDPSIKETLSTDPFNPNKRVALFHHMGFKRVSLSHFFSPLATEEEDVYDTSIPYILVAASIIPGEEVQASKEAVKGHITDYYIEYGIKNPINHLDYQQMMLELEALDESNLLAPLLDVDKQMSKKN